MAEQIQVIGVGSPLVDILAHVSEEFVAGIKGAKGGMELVNDEAMAELVDNLTEAPVKAPGGSAANTVLALARLGLSTTLLGKLGRDDLGGFYQANCAAAGVVAPRFKYDDGLPTGQCLCLVTPDSERTCRTFLGAASMLSTSEVGPDDFKGATHAHIEGYTLFNRELTIKILESAKAAGCTVSLDLAAFEIVRANTDILDDLLEDYVDIVFANEEEANAYSGATDPETALEALAKHCEIAAVKLGAEGAWLQRGTEKTKVNAQKVKAVDTTGAGDLWAAGFLYGHLTGKDLAACGACGALLGAAVVQVLGANIAIERWNQIKEKLP